MRRITVVLLTLLLVTAGLMTAHAQVTTSNISGVVKGEKGDLLAGATVTVTHEPTGAVFTVQSRTGGRFDVQNIPPGGPYTVKASYVGYGDFTRSDINIPLGERFDIQILLSSSTTELTSVVVSGRRTNNEKTGASTSFTRRQVLNTPNIGRSLTGVTKLTPQSNGNSFAGMNYRYNNLTIDGSLFNNNFGRSGDGMIPGGGVSAISIDAIDQLQVNISPFDVRQAGFIGSGINAVTRRGTNNWYGTAYGFYRNQDFTGDKVNGQDVPNADRSTKIYGASIGGPIIKNKLFFFVNFESEKREQPGQTFVAKKSDDDQNPQATGVLAKDLNDLKQFLVTKYNYDPGIYEGYNFKTENTKFLGRIDWNITNKHRLTLRYTQSETDDDDMINGSSSTGINAGNSRISNTRRGAAKTGGMAYNGSNFKNNTKVKSGVLELNSNFGTKVSNQLLASYTDNQLQRIPNSNFPFVDIMRDLNNVYISFGTDLFSYKNSISDKALNIADNVTINLGKHTLTAGASYEHLSFANSFASAGGPSYYRYASLNDFMTEKAPIAFGVTYDPTDRTNIKAGEAKFAQLGLYVQDVWAPSEKFKLTYGLRVDLPRYLEDPRGNSAIAALTFKDANGNPEQFDVSKWPDEKPLFSPRVGFIYDPEGDKSIIVRGGSGLFTGRIPFIWLVNQAGDNPALRSLYSPTGTDLAAIRFSTDRTTYIPPQSQIPTPGTSIPSGSSFTAIDDDFKMPQVWRSNLAVDKKLPGDFVLTFEAVYTKMVNNVFYRNANLGADTGKFAADGRPVFVTRLNAGVNQALVLDNTSKGSSTVLTAQLQKTFTRNWEAGIAYSYTFAQDVAIGTSDQSGSGWGTNQIAGNPNNPDLGYSNFSVPHRIVANGSYRFEYAKKTMATTIGLIYAGASQDRYMFRYGGDVNKDGSTNDLFFIPADPSTVQFANSYTPRQGGPTYTAQQQREAFVAFIENNKFLKKHKGQVMERYGAVLPWFHSLDARVLQDFSIKAGSKRHTLQFSVDIVNVLNLVNSHWGHRYSYTLGSTFQDQGILGLASGFNPTNPVYTFDAGVAKAYQPDYSTNSTWGIQLGLRYIFQ